MTPVHFTAESRKTFDKLKNKKLQTKITQAIQKLSRNPYSGKKLQGRLGGTYSIRVWPYRVLYELTKEREIMITDIGHRKDIYR